MRAEFEVKQEPEASRDLALYLVRSGQAAQALAIIDDLETPTQGFPLYLFAVIYELAGERDRALRSLKSAIAAGYSLTVIHAEPDFAALRQDARFTE